MEELSLWRDSHGRSFDCCSPGFRIDLPFKEIIIAIEMFVRKYSFFEHLNTEFSLSLHYILEHFVIILARKQKLACEHLK
jgi:hypothetical protein